MSATSPSPRRPGAVLWAASAAFLFALCWLWLLVIPLVEARATTAFGPFTAWDLETYFLPKFAFGSQELLRGVLPVWNRYEFAGIPFLATAQPAALYPLKLPPYVFLDAASGLRVVLVLHFALLGALFLLFARARNLGGTALTAGMLFVCFNVPFLLVMNLPIGATGLPWVAVVFLLADRFARAPRAVAFAGLGGVVALQLTAGYPEVVLDLSLLVALNALVLWALGETAEPPWKTIPLLAAAFTLGGLAAGLQTLPLLELLDQSGRAGFATAQIEETSAAGFAASPGVGGLIGLSIAAALWGERRRTLPATVGAAACLFMAVGGWKVLRWLPGLDVLRLSGSWPFLLQFFLAWLAALGVQGLLQARGAGRPAARRLIGALSLAWGTICVLGAAMPGFTTGVPAWLAAAAPAEGPAVLRVVAGGLGAAGSLALVAVALGPVRLPHRAALVSAGVLAVVLGQITSYPFGRPPTRIAVPETPLRTTALLGQDASASRILSLADARAGYHLLDRVENVFGREGSLQPPRFGALQHALGVVVQKQQIHWKKLARAGAVLDTLDVGYVLAPGPQRDELAAAGLHDSGRPHGRMRLYENRERPGRAWAVYGARVVGSPQEALEWVFQPTFDPSRSVVLERQTRERYPASSPRDHTPARVRYPSATLAEVEVEMEAPGILVLADSCFPGWEVEVDAEPAELLCANGLVRAVELGPGSHQVRFAYRSPAVRWGLRASAAGIVGLGAIPSLAALRRRRARG